MDNTIDTLGDARPGSPFARGLNVLLWGGIVLLGLICLWTVIFGIAMFFSNGLQEMVYAELGKAENTPSPEKLGVLLLAVCFMSAGYIYVVNMLRKTVKTLIKGDPFVPENISRLRSVWITLAAIEVFRMILGSALTVEIDALHVSDSDGATLDIRLGTWFLVFVIAALAEVFRHGAVLRRDQEYTI